MPLNVKPEPPDALYVTESSDGQMTATPVPVTSQPPQQQQQQRTTQAPQAIQPRPQTSKPTTQQPVASTSNNEPKKPDPMDEASARGIFGWTSIVDVNVPVLFRGKDKIHYVAVRIVETKLLSRYPNVYPQELKEKPPLHSYYVTANEVKLLNEINTHHCDFEYGHEPFTEKDLIVKLSEFVQFFKVVRDSFPDEKLKQMKFNPRSITRGGWVQVNNTVLPYVYRDDKERLVPFQVVKYAAGLMTDLNVKGQPGNADEVIFFNRVCKEAMIDFDFNSSLELFPLDVIRSNCKPTVIELPSHDPFSHAKFLPPAAVPIVMPAPPGYQVQPPGIQYGPGIMLNPANRMMHPMQMNRPPMNQMNGGVPQQQQQQRPAVPSNNTIPVQSSSQFVPRAPPNTVVQHPTMPAQHHIQLPPAYHMTPVSMGSAARPQVATTVAHSTPQPRIIVPRSNNQYAVMSQALRPAVVQSASHQHPALVIHSNAAPPQSLNNPVVANNAPRPNIPVASKPPPEHTLQLATIEGKRFLMVKKQGNNDLILVQDVVKQFFKPIDISEFLYALTDVLKVELAECSPSLSAVLLRARRLNEQKLACNKLIKVSDFCGILSKLNYIYKDRLLAAKLAKQQAAAKAAAAQQQPAVANSATSATNDQSKTNDVVHITGGTSAASVTSATTSAALTLTTAFATAPSATTTSASGPSATMSATETLATISATVTSASDPTVAVTSIDGHSVVTATSTNDQTVASAVSASSSISMVSTSIPSVVMPTAAVQPASVVTDVEPVTATNAAISSVSIASTVAITRVPSLPRFSETSSSLTTTTSENPTPTRDNYQEQRNRSGDSDILCLSSESSSSIATTTTTTTPVVSSNSTNNTTESLLVQTSSLLVPTSITSSASVDESGGEEMGLKIGMVMSLSEPIAATSASSNTQPELICLDD
ncbi:uncharacterized protein LOC141905770 [Tubulanus polymorphus]|uniref:uncharacterized protein LOC141905770 n=1 Tax=Tubulanus polymorphus TaxID=672921 RepID=UPI003DA43EEB